MRRVFLVFVVAAIGVSVVAASSAPSFLWAWIALGPLIGVGFFDYFQTSHALLRNFPIIAHGRYLLEMIRPEIHQYFVESDTEGVPFDRDQRSIVYQRAKQVRDTIPFGTKMKKA